MAEPLQNNEIRQTAGLGDGIFPEVNQISKRWNSRRVPRPSSLTKRDMVETSSDNPELRSREFLRSKSRDLSSGKEI